MIAILDMFHVTKPLVKDTGGVLTPALRKKLVNTIISYTVEERVWISTNQFDDVFNMIHKVFEGESFDMYFIKKEGGNTSADGAFYQSFRYRHKLLREENPGLAKNLKKNPKAANSTTVSVLPNDMEVIRKELISRFEPWSRILSD